MPSVYTPNATNNPTAYTQPADGDNANAASVLVMMQALADKGAFLGALWKPYVIATSTTILGAPATTATPIVSVSFPSFNLAATDIIVAIGSLVMGNNSTAITMSGALTYSGGSRAVDSYNYTPPSGGSNSSASYVWAGSVAASPGATAYTVSGLSSATTGVTAVRLFFAILRQG